MSRVLQQLCSTGSIPRENDMHVHNVITKANKALRTFRSKRKDTPLTVGVICGELSEKEISTLENVRKVISLCEALYNSTGNDDGTNSCIVAGILLFLAEFGEDVFSRYKLRAFVTSYITNDPATVIDAARNRRQLPEYGDEVYEIVDWDLFLQGVIIALTSEDVFPKLQESLRKWRGLKQTSSVERYLIEESELFERILAYSNFVHAEPPGTQERSYNLLKSLNADMKSTIAKKLRNSGRHSETMSFVEITTLIREIGVNSTIRFSWEQNSTNQQPRTQNSSLSRIQSMRHFEMRMTSDPFMPLILTGFSRVSIFLPLSAVD